MYIIFGSKKNVYKSIPGYGVEIVEKYIYRFNNEIKLEINIAKVFDNKSKIRVVDCVHKNCENLIPVKFFGNFTNIIQAKKEIDSLVCYGNLNTNLEKIL